MPDNLFVVYETSGNALAIARASVGVLARCPDHTLPGEERPIDFSQTLPSGDVRQIAQLVRDWKKG